MSFLQTLKDIEFIKNNFQNELKTNLNLIRVSAPLFLEKDSGFNDDLNGTERKVSFDYKNKQLEVVQSLAKWKRFALKKYNIEGLYADMNAIRKDEEIDEIHSMYVDQWDWEMVIHERSEKQLRKTVKLIFKCIKNVDMKLSELHTNRERLIKTDNIYFISSEELLKMYPNLSSKERENEICKLHGVVFISKIGCKLSNNEVHDKRAPDYDDWNLNGDILVWNPILDDSLELSSMGIRVNSNIMIQQLKELNMYDEKKELRYHKMILNEELPNSIGGGIGQSRLCMYLLQKKHIAEVQCSVWNENIENSL